MGIDVGKHVILIYVRTLTDHKMVSYRAISLAPLEEWILRLRTKLVEKWFVPPGTSTVVFQCLTINDDDNDI